MSRTPAAGDTPDVSTANFLPPIIDLGRALASNDIAHCQLDQLTCRRSNTPTEDAAMDLLLKRRDALWQLIASLPAVTLADAAVQLGVACHFAMSLEASDWSSADVRGRFYQLAGGLELMCLSMLPLVAEAAGLDLAEIDWTGLDHLRASRFYGSERTA